MFNRAFAAQLVPTLCQYIRECVCDNLIETWKFVKFLNQHCGCHDCVHSFCEFLFDERRFPSQALDVVRIMSASEQFLSDYGDPYSNPFIAGTVPGATSKAAAVAAAKPKCGPPAKAAEEQVTAALKAEIAKAVLEHFLAGSASASSAVPPLLEHFLAGSASAASSVPPSAASAASAAPTVDSHVSGWPWSADQAEEESKQEEWWQSDGGWTKVWSWEWKYQDGGGSSDQPWSEEDWKQKQDWQNDWASEHKESAQGSNESWWSWPENAQSSNEEAHLDKKQKTDHKQRGGSLNVHLCLRPMCCLI